MRQRNQKVYYSILAICYLEVSPVARTSSHCEPIAEGSAGLKVTSLSGTAVDHLPALQLRRCISKTRGRRLHHPGDGKSPPLSPAACDPACVEGRCFEWGRRPSTGLRKMVTECINVTLESAREPAEAACGATCGPSDLL